MAVPHQPVGGLWLIVPDASIRGRHPRRPLGGCPPRIPSPVHSQVLDASEAICDRFLAEPPPVPPPFLGGGGRRRVFPVPANDEIPAADRDPATSSYCRRLEGENAALRQENRSLKRTLEALEAAASAPPPAPPPVAEVTPETLYRRLDD